MNENSPQLSTFTRTKVTCKSATTIEVQCYLDALWSYGKRWSRGGWGWIFQYQTIDLILCLANRPQRQFASSEGSLNYAGIDLDMIFIDLEKAYNKVLREVLERCLVKEVVLVAYNWVTKDMYEELDGCYDIKRKHKWLSYW